MKKIILFVLFAFCCHTGWAQEDFETGVPPTGWITSNGTNGVGDDFIWQANPSSIAPYQGSVSAYINNENIGQGNTEQDWLISPQMVIPTDGQLRFWVRQMALGDANTLFRVMISTGATQNDLASFSLAEQWTEAELNDFSDNDVTDYDLATVDFASEYFGQTVYIAFVREYTQPTALRTGERFLIDMVSLVQKCQPPSNLNASNPTCNGANLVWTAPGSATDFQVVVMPESDPFNASLAVDVTGTAYTPSNLTGGVNYSFYVRTDCGDDNYSNWVGPLNFSTSPMGSSCNCPLPIASFPFQTTDNTGNYGDSTDTSQGPSPNFCGATPAGTNYMAGNNVFYSYTPPTDCPVNVWMDPVQGNSGIFVYEGCSNIGSACIAGMANSNSGPRSFSFNAIGGQTYIIAISSSANTQSIGYDMILQCGGTSPECTVVTPISGGTASNIQTNSATPATSSAELTWVGGASSVGDYTSWEVVVQPAALPIPSGGGVIANTNSDFPVSGLQPGTEYEYWVRAICDGDTTVWYGPYTFETPLCNDADKCTYTFRMTDSANNGWNGARMQIRQNGDVLATIGSTYNSGAGPVDVTVSLCDGSPFEVFWSTAGSQPQQCILTVLNSFGQPIFQKPAGVSGVNQMVYGGLVNCDEETCFTFPLSVTTPTISTNGAVIAWDAPGTSSWDIYIAPIGGPVPDAGTVPTYDDVIDNPFTTTIPLTPDTAYDVCVRVNCEPILPQWVCTTFTTIPTCPKPTNISVGTPTLNSVTVNWSPGTPTDTDWEIILVPGCADAPPPPGVIPPAEALSYIVSSADVTGTAPGPYSYEITGLDPATIYYYYIRTLCPLDDKSTWTGPVKFNTITCEASDKCQYKFVLTDLGGNGWNGGRMQIRQNCIVITPNLGATISGAGPTTVNVQLCDDVPFDVFWVTEGTAPSEIGFQIINPFNDIIYTYEPGTGTPNTVIYSGVVECDPPSCPKPTDLVAANPTQTTADLSWTETGTATQWEVYVVPTGTAAPVNGSPVSGAFPYFIADTNVNFQVTGLQPGTRYDFYVRALCSPTDNSTWTILPSPGQFITKPVNDECISAIAAQVNPTWSCNPALNTHGNTLGATSSGPVISGSGCGNSNDDVWFSFVATNAIHTIDILNTIGTPASANANHNVFSGNCAESDGFQYQITDANGVTSVGQVNVAVAVAVAPAATPSAKPNAASTLENTPVTIAVLANDSFGTDGAAASSFVVSTPANGTAVVSDNGTPTVYTDDVVIYTPNAAFVGTDTFTYTIADADGQTSTATVTVTVGAAISPATPIAGADTASVSENTPVTIDVLANDTFGTAGPGSGAITILSQPVGGTVTVNDNGTPNDPSDDTLTYTPNADYITGLTNLYCSDPNSSVATGLTVGETYYIRVYSAGGNNNWVEFDLCIGTPPPPATNDECDTAIAIEVNEGGQCYQTTAGNLIGATASTGVSNGCPGTEDDDVWFSFVAEQTRQLISIRDILGTTTNLEHAVYSGSCGSLTQMFCGQGTDSDASNFIVGNTYYIRVWSSASTSQVVTFEMCVRGVSTCENAETFCGKPQSSPDVYDNTTGLPNSQQVACLGSIPNPTYHVLKISQEGDLNFTIVQNTQIDYITGVVSGNNLDVDFVLWGPFEDPESCDEISMTDCPSCPNNTTNPNFYPFGNIVDCSYDPSFTESFTIPNAQVGQFYILLVTNFNGTAGQIMIYQDNINDEDAGISACCGVELGDDIAVCGQNSVILNAVTGIDEDFQPHTFEWFFNGSLTPIPGADGPTLEVFESGVYTVRGTCGYVPESDSINVLLGPAVETETPLPYIVCDTPPADGFATFDLNVLTPQVLGNLIPEEYVVTYHETEIQANDESALIDILLPYANIVAYLQTIYVRVESVTIPSCYAVVPVQLQVVAPADATFSYPAAQYCLDDTATTVVPAVTTAGGSFEVSPETGLIVDPNTGAFTVAGSTPGLYEITHTIPATANCPEVSIMVTVEIVAPAEADFSYSQSSYCTVAPDETPVLEGVAGEFTAVPPGLAIDPLTGTINFAGSAEGTYDIINTIPASGSCAEVVSSVVQVTISTLQDATFTYSATEYCKDSATNPMPIFTTGSAGNFTADPVTGLDLNPTTGEIILANSTQGTYIVTNTIPANGGCAEDIKTFTVSIYDPVSAAFTYPAAAYCTDVATAEPVFAVGASAGNFSATPAGLVIDSATGVLNLTDSATGVYLVTNQVNNNGNCPGDTQSFTVEVTEGAVGDLDYNGSDFCRNITTAQMPNISAPAGGSYSGSNGLQIDASTGAIVPSANAAGVYDVFYELPASGACPLFQASTTIVIMATSEVAIEQDCEGGVYIFRAVPVNGSFDPATASFSWSGPGVTATDEPAAIRATLAGTYQVTVTTPEGCVSIAEDSTSSIACGIQKGISPNNDGSNENFDLSKYDVEEITIFNRYGTEVYQRRNYVDEWHGQDKGGNELPSSTYFYVIKTAAGEELSGWIYVIR